MRVDELQLKGFGKWQDAVFRFAPGINVFAAPNEAGKSTLLQGIFAALYGMKRDYVKSARYLPEYEKYRPWHHGDYETIITYHLAGKTYRLHRYLQKEREQARIFLDPEWTELTDVYQEDRRKERNFLELHLGLNRSLFTDITWIRREPLTAGEHLMPSLTTETVEANPAVNQILAELDRELTGIGKKERAENTLLGKATALAIQKEQELAQAESAWKTVSHLTRQLALWEEERLELEQLRNRLQRRKRSASQQEQEWQKRWQASYSPPDEQQWDWWEGTAASPEEQKIHREARAAMAEPHAGRNHPAADDTSLPQVELERLQADYAKGAQLRKAREECHLELARLAATTVSAGSRRQARSDRQGTKAQKWPKQALLWGSAAFSVAVGVIAFMAGQPTLGGFVFVLAVTLAGIGWLLGRSKQGGQDDAAAGEHDSTKEWQRLQNEISQLDNQLKQLLGAWNAADWDAFLSLREEWQSKLFSQESNQLAAMITKKDEEAVLLNRWGNAVRSHLEKEKAVRESEQNAWQSELQRIEERMQELREQIARAHGEMSVHDTVSVAQARGEYEEAVAGLRQLQMKREALQLTRDTLQEALAEWNRDVSPAVNQQASEAMAQITGGTYRDVRLDPQAGFAVRLLEPSRQMVLEQEQCSTGTQDQLYLSQRLALHHYVSKQTEPLPLFLDDHFVHYDQERLEKTLAFLAKRGEDHQIFLFTCQDRELQALEPFLRHSGRHAIHHLG